MTERAPLTIAYRSNTRWPFCTESHVTKSLEAMGHRVVLLQEDRTSWDACVTAAKAAQVFLWTKTWSIDEEGGHEALRAIREAGTISASFHLDRYHSLERSEQMEHDPFWRTACVFTADGGHQDDFAALGINHRWSPPGVYDAECGIGRRNKRRFPERVVFVGSHPYPHPEWRPYRDELLARLSAHYGAAFGIYPKTRNQPIRGQALADLYATAEVVIGDSCLSGDPTPTHYWSDRAPEVMGRGAFLVHPAVAGMEDWYTDGEHLRTYPLGGWENLLATVDYYLAHPDERRAIAAAGAALVASRDTYRHRMVAVLDALDDQFGIPEPRPQPATVSATRERPLPRAGARTNGVARPNGMLLANRSDRTPGPALVRVRHRGRGMPAAFEVAGGPTAERALREVWDDDTYGIEAGHVYGKVVVDLGGNLGAFAVLAARLGARSVHTFEPHPESYPVLVRNLERNGVVSKVTPHRQAVLGRARSAVLVGAGGGAHIGGPGDGEDVEAVGIIEALDAAAGPGGAVGLLKMDIEGGEFDVAAALDASVLHERVERIVLENHGPGMPHLGHLDADGKHLERWCALVAMLADCGRLDIFGHPMVGGVMRWVRY